MKFKRIIAIFLAFLMVLSGPVTSFASEDLDEPKDSVEIIDEDDTQEETEIEEEQPDLQEEINEIEESELAPQETIEEPVETVREEVEEEIVGVEELLKEEAEETEQDEELQIEEEPQKPIQEEPLVSEEIEEIVEEVFPIDVPSGLNWSSMRLLVATSDTSLVQDAISDYNGIYMLQYSTIEEAQKAYTLLKDKVDFIELDQGLSIAEGEAAETVNTENVMTEEENPFSEAESLPNVKGFDIALIDTGANADKSVSVIGENPSDENGHGTSMLSYIMEENPNAKVLSIKALDANGKGDVSTVYAAIEYAASQNVDIINLSISALAGKDSQLIENAINDAVNKGITVVGSAGNNGKDAKYYTPGGIQSATIIGSCTAEGVRLSQSNFGPSVDYNFVSSSTSEAAARFSGYISLNEVILNNGRIYEPNYVPEQENGTNDDADSEETEPFSEETAFTPSATFLAHYTNGVKLNTVAKTDEKYLDSLKSILNPDYKATDLVVPSGWQYIVSLQDWETPQYVRKINTTTSSCGTFRYPKFLKVGQNYYDVLLTLDKIVTDRGRYAAVSQERGIYLSLVNRATEGEDYYPSEMELQWTIKIVNPGTNTLAPINDLVIYVSDLDGAETNVEAWTFSNYSATTQNTIVVATDGQMYNSGTVYGTEGTISANSRVAILHNGLRSTGTFSGAYGGYSIDGGGGSQQYGSHINFMVPTYTVKYQATTGGTIVGKTSETVFLHQNPTSTTANANDGYYKTVVTVDKAVTLTDGTRISAGGVITTAQIKMVDVTEDLVFTVHFEKYHVVQYRATTGGRITGKTEENRKTHENPTSTTVVANTGYRQKNITVNKAVTLTDGTKIAAGGVITAAQLKQVDVTQDLIFTVNFEKIPYTITTKVTGGTIDPSVTVLHGDSKTIKYSPNTGYRLYSVKVDGASVNKNTYSGSYAFNNVTANHNIDVVYRPNPAYTVTKTTTKNNFNVNEAVTYTIKIKQTVNNAYPENVTLTDNEITNGMNIIANTVKASKGTATLSNNALTWKGTLAYNEEVTITYDAKPNKSVFSSPTASNKATIKGDETGITATVTKIVNEKVNIVTKVTNGTITPSENNISVGQNRTITFKPNEGYFLKTLKVDGVNQNLSSRDIYNADTYVFNALKDNHEIEAVYARIPVYTISKAVDPNKPNYNISETIRYTIVASQIWPDAEPESATITDNKITDGMRIIEGTVEVNYGNVSLSNNQITWKGTIDNANPVVITYDAKAEVGTFKSKTADNTATIQGDKHKRSKTAEVKKPITVDVTTEINNGEITPTEREIPMQEDRRVEYSAPSGWYVKRVELDGNEMPRTPSLEGLDLNTLIDNHHVKVTTAPIPELEITKVSDHKKVYKFEDTVTYTVEIENVREGSETEGIYIEDLGMENFLIDLDSVEIAEIEDCEVVPSGNGFIINAPNCNLKGGDKLTLTYSSTVLNIPDGVSESENTVKVKSHPSNEPPYEDEKSTTEIVDIVIKVTTEIVNGEITPSNEEVVVGESPKVKWTPNDNYYVKEIEIDGKVVDRNDYNGETIFPDVQEDHHVKVTCAKIPRLEIEKESSSDTVYKFDDRITYTVKVTNVEEDSITEGLYIEDSGIPYFDIDINSIAIEGMEGNFQINVREDDAYEASDKPSDEPMDEPSDEPADEPEVELDNGKGFIITSEDGLEYGKTLTITYTAVVREIPDEEAELTNVVLAKSNPRFKPPYEDEASTNKTLDVVIKINTEIIGGTITPSDDKVKVGTSPRVEWTPDDGYYVKEIFIDGEKVNRDDFDNFTEFLDIQKDHDVKVVCAPIPKLEIEKTAEKERVERGSDKLTYTIKVRNIVKDSITEGFLIEDTGVKAGAIKYETLVVSRHAGTASKSDDSFMVEKTENGFILTSDEGLAFGTELIITYEVEFENIPDGITDFTNIVVARSNPKFNPPYNDEVRAEESAYVNDPVLEIEKMVDKRKVKIGEKALYTIKIRQIKEDMEATNVLFSDMIEEGIEIDISSIKLNGEKAEVEVKDNSFSYTIASLKHDEEMVFTYEGTAKQAGTIKNTASITSDQNKEPQKAEVTLTVVKPEPPKEPEKPEPPKEPEKPEEPKEPEKPEEPKETPQKEVVAQEPENPKTGDQTNAVLYIALGLMSILGCVILRHKKRWKGIEV